MEKIDKGLCHFGRALFLSMGIKDESRHEKSYLPEKKELLYGILLFCQLRRSRWCGMIKFQKSDHFEIRKGCGFFYEKERCRAFWRMFFRA